VTAAQVSLEKSRKHVLILSQYQSQILVKICQICKALSDLQGLQSSAKSARLSAAAAEMLHLYVNATCPLSTTSMLKLLILAIEAASPSRFLL
jgi:uncharacterized protein YhbP (UPF0306 family)